MINLMFSARGGSAFGGKCSCLYMFSWFKKIDFKFFRFLNGLAGRYRWLDYLGIFCAVYLIWLIAAVALFFFWFTPLEASNKLRGAAQFSPKFLNRLRYLFCLLASSGAAYLVNLLIGLSFVRTRPFGGLDGVHQLINASFLHKSFPSSHATIAFALAFTVFFFNKSWGVPLLAAATLVALGRVYTGVHYPLDVVAGAVLGGVASYVIYRLII